MNPPFNQLTPKQAELLTCLAEECAEVSQNVAKALRHGLDSCHPVTKITNKTGIQSELGDLLAIYRLLVGAGILNSTEVWVAEQEKSSRVTKYLHHFNDEQN